MNEVSGALKPVVEAYLNGRILNDREIRILRAYLKQWVDAGDWRGVEELRESLDKIESHAELLRWIDEAEDAGGGSVFRFDLLLDARQCWCGRNKTARLCLCRCCWRLLSTPQKATLYIPGSNFLDAYDRVESELRARVPSLYRRRRSAGA